MTIIRFIVYIYDQLRGKGGARITSITCNRQVFLALVPTVCFVAIQTRTMVKRMGMN